jgi:hypothetical protein
MENSPSSNVVTAASCSLISRTNSEPLIGTAPQAEQWYILEHPQNFGRKALEESELPESLRNHLIAQTKGLSEARVQLVKRDGSNSSDNISFFIGVTTAERPHLYEFHLSNYLEVLDLDIQKILFNPADYAKFVRTEPLFLVCTNGKRDPCCAKHGLSVYSAISDLAPASTWQTSHVGGHRFAANLVCFPHGLFYGRLNEADAQTVIETYGREEFLLERYRGRSCFPGEVQAAEYYLHAQTGDNAIHSYSLDRVHIIREHLWEILFFDASSSKKHRLVIAGVPSKFEILQSCRESERIAVMQYQLEAYQELGSGG